MRSILLIILVIGFTQCKTMENEIATFNANKVIIQKEFPNSFAKPITGYNDVFTVSNPNYVYMVKLKNNAIVQLDTLKSFNSKTTVVSKN